MCAPNALGMPKSRDLLQLFGKTWAPHPTQQQTVSPFLVHTSPTSPTTDTSCWLPAWTVGWGGEREEWEEGEE